MHVDDFALLMRRPSPEPDIDQGAVKELAPLLRSWVNGSPNTACSESETARDYSGRVVYTTAAEAQRNWLLRRTSAAQRVLSVHAMGQLLMRCGFRRRSVNGRDGLKVYRYYTPAHLLDMV